MRQGDLQQLRAGPGATQTQLLQRISRLARRTGHPLTDMICLDESLFADQRIFLELGKFVIDANDLYIRMPYGDSAVTSHAEAVPPDLRYRKHVNGRRELKSFFKDVMRDRKVLPEELIYRPKEWMNSPTAKWLRGPLGRILEAIALSRSAQRRGYFDMGRVRGLISEHRAGLADHTYPFLMLAGIEIWHRLFIDPPAIGKPEHNLSDIAAAG